MNLYLKNLIKDTKIYRREAWIKKKKMFLLKRL